jgi:hypothetical protein
MLSTGLHFASESTDAMPDPLLLKFIVGPRVVSEGEDSRFEGVVVSVFVKRDERTVVMSSRTMMAVAHCWGGAIAFSDAQGLNADYSSVGPSAAVGGQRLLSSSPTRMVG